MGVGRGRIFRRWTAAHLRRRFVAYPPPAGRGRAIPRHGKPVARRGRKAMGPRPRVGQARIARLPKGEGVMKKMLQKVAEFLKREDGPTAVEYAVMLALIIVVCITAITA